MQVSLDELLAEEFTERDYSEAILELRNLQRLGRPGAITWAFNRLTRRDCNPDVVLRIVRQWPTDRMVTPEYADNMYRRRCFRGARRLAEEFPVTNPFGELRVSHDGGNTYGVATPEQTAAFAAVFAAPSVPAEDAVAPTEHPGFGDWALLWVSEHTPRIEAKAREYGANSLAAEGRLFARACGRDNVPHAEAIEIGCMVYAYGKIERVIDAMLRGELPSIDSWHDPAVYALMAMYTRSAGRWP